MEELKGTYEGRTGKCTGTFCWKPEGKRPLGRRMRRWEYRVYTKNGAVSKVNRKFISHLTRPQRTPLAAANVQVSHALPAVRFSCLLRGRGASFQDGVAAEKDFMCALF
jgi:hypothetical protein